MTCTDLLHVVEIGSPGPDARSVLKAGEWTERANEVVAAATETPEAESFETFESEILFGVHRRRYGTPPKRTRSISLFWGRTARPILAGI